MLSIHSRDDLEKLKKLQETKSLLLKERIKEKLGKQDFHYDIEEVFEPVILKTRNKTKLKNRNFLKSKYKRYVILLKLQHKQSKIRQEQ